MEVNDIGIGEFGGCMWIGKATIHSVNDPDEAVRPINFENQITTDKKQMARY